MKIQIDLNEILGDENGVETLQESVRRQVIERLSVDIDKKISKAVDDEISENIRAGVKKVCDEQLPLLLKELLDTEYTPVEKYGQRGQPTTIRKTLLATLEDQMQYKKKDGWGNREKNYFSEHVDAVTSTCLSEFEKSFRAQIDDNFKRAALESAVKILSEKLGVK